MKWINSQLVLNYDERNNTYLIASISEEEVQPWLYFLQGLLGDVTFFHYTRNQQLRDHNTYHMSVVIPSELSNFLSKNQNFLNSVVGYPVSIAMIGTGRLKEEDNEVYFVVCECQETRNLRRSLDLPKQDFHVTLAFKKSDIFDQPKDRSTLISPYNQLEHHINNDKLACLPNIH